MSAAKSYARPVEIDEVMEGGTVARVVASRHPGFGKGDIVYSYSGWQSLAISDGSDLRKLDPSLAPPSTALGVLGMPGFTAYSGLLTIGSRRREKLSWLLRLAVQWARRLGRSPKSRAHVPLALLVVRKNVLL